MDLGESAEGKDARDAQMILNHKHAIELFVEQAAEIGFNRYTFSTFMLCYRKICFPTLELLDGCVLFLLVSMDPVYHPLEVPQLIEECFQQILDTATAITNPFEQAFFVMVHLPYLQPFEDVNKRVSRLAPQNSLNPAESFPFVVHWGSASSPISMGSWECTN